MPGESEGTSSEGRVWTYRSRQKLRREHETATIVEIARRIAELKHIPYAGDWQPDAALPGRSYIVPDETLSSDRAASLGIRAEDDLFGGIVPHQLVATKVVTHSLYHPDAAAPDAFSREFGDDIKSVVLPGFTAFSDADARIAGVALLESGPVRIKPSRAKGGLGQMVARSEVDLVEKLNECDRSEMEEFGLVLEQDLRSIETCSVGFATIGAMSIAYYGVQTLTESNHHEVVYGGSRIVAVRGGPKALLKELDHDRQRLAVAQARAYDMAARRRYGILASRRNYDVAQGIDARGIWRSGVLEQSWRVGGASPAEILAFAAFRDDPGRDCVRVCCVERYGESIEIPDTGELFYRGVDEHAGPLTKYALLLT
jgi:hypothetical protein